MKGRWLVALLSGSLAFGCGAPSSSPTGVPARKVEQVEAPPSLSPTDLAMITGQARLKVGDSAEDADRAFPTPPNAFPFKELPPQFNGLYRAKGFETATGGFGAVFYENRIAAMVYRMENITPGEVQASVHDHELAFGGPNQTLPGMGIQYWFWFKEDHVLMVCAVPDREQPEKFDLTIGLGQQVVMDALRMSYRAAKEDQSIGEKRRAQNPNR